MFTTAPHLYSNETMLTAIIAGWLAGIVTRGYGFGAPMNFLLGFVGGMLARIIVELGVPRPAWPLRLLASTLGALVVIWIGRRVAVATRPSSEPSGDKTTR